MAVSTYNCKFLDMTEWHDLVSECVMNAVDKSIMAQAEVVTEQVRHGTRLPFYARNPGGGSLTKKATKPVSKPVSKKSKIRKLRIVKSKG